MNKYLITYDLKNNSHNYDELYLSIKSLGPWWHHLDSTWIVKTNLTSSQIWTQIGSKITNIDRLLIVKIEPNDKYGWLTQDAWGWLNS